MEITTDNIAAIKATVRNDSTSLFAAATSARGGGDRAVDAEFVALWSAIELLASLVDSQE